MKREHGFKSHNNNSVTPATSQTSQQQQRHHTIKCFDCGFMVTTKDELMQHKKIQHWKQKPCPYFHGSGAGCRFPERVCFNIHKLSEHQGQVHGVRQEAMNRGNNSWAGVSGGRKEQGKASEIRARIKCREGNNCVHFNQGSCRYNHSNLTNQTNQTNPSNQTNQNNQTNQTNENRNVSSFNMQEMKSTLESLVEAVYNLKSLSDFPKVGQTNQAQ